MDQCTIKTIGRTDLFDTNRRAEKASLYKVCLKGTNDGHTPCDGRIAGIKTREWGNIYCNDKSCWDGDAKSADRKFGPRDSGLGGAGWADKIWGRKRHFEEKWARQYR
jgi:hypothetical protein